MKLYEISTISTGRSSVDRDAGVIRSVKILGRESKNGRTYSDKALNEAARQYEGCDVNVNHPDRSKPNSERRIEDGIGWLESVRVERDGVYGDLHYLKEHPSAGLVVEAAERKSNRFGLSHNAQGTVTKVNGKNVVESIDRVLSVDLVQNPATNAGLFESTQQTIREALELHAPELLKALEESSGLLPPEVMDEPMAPGGPEEGAAETVKSACAQILTAMLDLPGNVAAMCTQLIQVCQKVIAGQPEPKDPMAGGDPNDPNADPNADPANQDPNAPKAPDAGGDGTNQPAGDQAAGQDASAAPDPANPFEKRKKPMAESMTPESTKKELADLREQVRELTEQLATRTLREECEALLQSHRKEITPARLTALANMPTPEARLALIEELPSIEEPEQPKARRPNFLSPAAHGSVGPYPASVKDLVEACR